MIIHFSLRKRMKKDPLAQYQERPFEWLLRYIVLKVYLKSSHVLLKFIPLRKIDQILATTSEAKLNLFPTAQDKKPFCPLRVLRVTLGGEIV